MEKLEEKGATIQLTPKRGRFRASNKLIISLLGVVQKLGQREFTVMLA